MNVKKNNIKYIVIVAFVIVIMSVIILIVLGDAKDDTSSVGTESEIIESEMRESEVIESEVLSTEDKETEFEETESQMTSEMETQQEASPGDNAATTKPGNTENNSGSTNKGGNTGNNSGSGNAGNNSGSSGGGNISEIAPNIPQYDPADTNKDGWVDANEEMRYITPQKQKCIDAGYGVVVEQDDGKWYSILCKNGDQLFNGKMGNEVLREYLKERNLHPDQIIGSWINSDNEWYWYVAEGITEIPQSGDNTGDIDWDKVNSEIEWN